MRLIDADALIADLEYDIAIDEDILNYVGTEGNERKHTQFDKDCKQNAIDLLMRTPTIDAMSVEWIPCEERLPENIRPVLVTWKNNDPKSYYQYIVGKHFIGTAHYYRGKWYWYSSVTEDLLAEYGKCDTEEFDEAIEAVAWMPLPKPYERSDT